MNAKIIRFTAATAMLGALLMWTGGCVSTGTYEAMEREADAAKKEAKQAKLEYAQERLRVLTLEKRNKELKQQTDKWEANLRRSIDRLEQLADSWGEVRDDLIRLNIERELHSMKRSDKTAKGFIRLEPQKRSAAKKGNAGASAEVPTGKDRKDLDNVLKDFRGLLEKG